MILEDYIDINARLYPDKTAIVCDHDTCTYEDLKNRIKDKMILLEKVSYHKGQIVCLRAFASIDYLVTYFALHKMGCIVTPLEKDLPDESFERISQEICSNRVPDGTADILYTTGTTGKSKGVLISHQTIIADAENLIDGQGFCHELAFVINGPLNHIGSLSKIYPTIVLGATLILVDGLKDINKFWKAFDYPATRIATFLVPASIRILIQFSAKKLAEYADKIDFIETGAAAISHGDMKSLCELLPNSRLYNTYASTETGIICTYNFNDGRCIAGCVGKPMKHSQVIITENGHIACKGDTLMTGYLGDVQRTSEILKDGVVYTSDIGILDVEGMLHLSGREDDVINVGGLKVAPTEVEDIAQSYPIVKDCVCISVEHKITGNALKLLIVVKDGEILNKRALAQYLKSKLELYKVPLLYEKVENIKRTFNGKIDRKYYK